MCGFSSVYVGKVKVCDKVLLNEHNWNINMFNAILIVLNFLGAGSSADQGLEQCTL